MSTIKYEQVVFLQENKTEIDHIVEEFKRMSSKVISNTLVQMTNPDLISDIIDAGEFVYNNDITPTSLKLIQRCIENMEEYVSREDFKKCEEAVKSLSSLLSKAVKNNKKE